MTEKRQRGESVHFEKSVGRDTVRLVAAHPALPAVHWNLYNFVRTFTQITISTISENGKSNAYPEK